MFFLIALSASWQQPRLIRPQAHPISLPPHTGDVLSERPRLSASPKACARLSRSAPDEGTLRFVLRSPAALSAQHRERCRTDDLERDVLGHSFLRVHIRVCRNGGGRKDHTDNAHEARTQLVASISAIGGLLVSGPQPIVPKNLLVVGIHWVNTWTPAALHHREIVVLPPRVTAAADVGRFALDGHPSAPGSRSGGGGSDGSPFCSAASSGKRTQDSRAR